MADLIGKPIKSDEVDFFGVEKVIDSKSFLIKIGGAVTCDRMERMGNTVDEIKKFQLFRLIKSSIFLILGLAVALVMKSSIPIVIGVLGFVVMWFFDYLRVNNHYEMFQFKRQLDFNKFIRMLMPYLRGNEVTLYQALNKMKDRLEDGTTRTALVTLIAKLNGDMDSVIPYEEFAEEASGVERSKLIMQTLFDFNQSSNDSTTINELGKIVDTELEKDIDEIIEKKDDKFEHENYLLGFSMVIVVFAYAASIVVTMLIDFSSKM